MANLNIEETQEQARKLLNSRIESVTNLVKARQRVTDLKEQLAEAEREDKKAYVRAGAYPNPGFDKALQRAKADQAWRTYDVPCGHDVMVDMPERLAEILTA